jgi:phosphoribosyl 1,2-cyclic phosphate phosphodiesterase
MKLIFLGTGTSFGIPQVSCTCAVCHSDDPRDRRTRVGAVVELPAGRLLIDTPPELRLQLIANGVDRADVVLFTHDHADHTHGLDDVRSFAHHAESPLPIYGPAECLEGVQRKFAYVFDPSMRPLKGTSKPEGTLHPVEPGVSFTVLGQAITPVEVPHGRIRVFGYRIGDLGYVTDAKEIPPAAEAVLKGVRVLVLNALFRQVHPTHLSISEAVETARRIGAERTFLTHITHRTSHAELEAELPDDIRPAFDGLHVEVH